MPMTSVTLYYNGTIFVTNSVDLEGKNVGKHNEIHKK